MPVNYQVGGSNFEDVFIRRDLFAQGGLWLWGNNYYGGIGDDTRSARSSPVQTIAGGNNWKLVVTGRYHTAAIKTDSTLWLWGYNLYGQLGTGNTTFRSSPVQTISGGNNWKMVSADPLSGTTAAIKTDGSLWSWGDNTGGQLGDNTTANKNSPVQTVAGGNTWKQVSHGQNYASAIKTDGTLWTWGVNAQGQLGTNNTTNRSSPAQTISADTNWKQVTCGQNTTAAIKTDGTLWLWGNNTYGQLGNNTSGADTRTSSPVQTISGGNNWKQISSGGPHFSAIKTDGTLWLWGKNNYGQLGDNTRDDKSSPVQTDAGGTNWKQCSSSYWNTVVIKTDGTLWTWGTGFAGQLGDNTRTPKSSPIQTIAGGSNWKYVGGVGQHRVAAIKDDF